jgi:hypothetical protein
MGFGDLDSMLAVPRFQNPISEPAEHVGENAPKALVVLCDEDCVRCNEDCVRVVSRGSPFLADLHLVGLACHGESVAR